MEEGSGLLAGAVEGDISSQGIAREVDLLGREPLVEVVVGHTDGLGFLTHVAVGLARIGVLLLDDGRDAQPVGGFQRGTAGETTHTNNHIGMETLQDAACLAQATDEFEGQAECREVFGKSADPQTLDRITRLGHALHLHAALRTDKEDVDLGESPLQGIRNGNGGKDVAARATTTNHDFQVLFHLQ